MTKAQQYHERMRDEWLGNARLWNTLDYVGEDRVRHAVKQARHHNHKAIHVARLTRARQAQP